MSVIALIGNKGGSGKTMLTVNLATALARHGTTAVLDADPRRSALKWRALSQRPGGPPVIDTVWDLEDVVERASGRYNHVFIDCPPSMQASQSEAALRISDLALIPLQPHPLDLWATVHIEQSIEQAREVNPKLKAKLVINQLEPRTRLSRTVRRGLGELGLPTATTAIRRRVAYRTSVLEGKSVLEMGRRGTAATVELHDLIREVIPQ